VVALSCCSPVHPSEVRVVLSFFTKYVLIEQIVDDNA
jgi:hypothetical protein